MLIENEELENVRKELSIRDEKVAKLQEELSMAKNINNSLLKKVEAYTQLQLKYATDTMKLAKDKEKLSKQLAELTTTV